LIFFLLKPQQHGSTLAALDEEPKEEEEKEEDMFDDFGNLKNSNKKVLEAVDHAKIEYTDFRKEFYVEVPEIEKMTPDEVTEYRKSHLENLRIRGKGCPKPIKNFSQCGLSTKMYHVAVIVLLLALTMYRCRLELMKHYKYDKPTPIQAQAVPAIMSGRDVIGIAKTGSGKTLAFLLPMFRHILDQPPLQHGDGPIGIVMAPTRELATQIHTEIKKFKKATNLTVRNPTFFFFLFEA
jgi:ATP-dependent RNA helicase DDX46/PRP5